MTPEAFQALIEDAARQQIVWPFRDAFRALIDAVAERMPDMEPEERTRFALHLIREQRDKWAMGEEDERAPNDRTKHARRPRP